MGNFVDNSDIFIKAMENKKAQVLETIGLFIQGEAMDLLNKPMPHKHGASPRPYQDTGTLKNSIAYAVTASDETVHIGTNTEYAEYIHDGTVYIAPNRFLKDAVEINHDQIREFIKNELKS